MNNCETEATWSYHDGTKHSAWSVRHNAHFLDWRNMPMPFKIYPTLDALKLPRETPQSGVAALSAIAHIQSPARDSAIPDLNALASLLYFSAGITKQRKYPGGEFFFRAAACTGALYEIELYLVCADLPALKAGVYHFSPADFALRQLRSGDFRSLLVRATGEERAVAHAPVTVICTGTYWRNAWKYQARTYRHFGWDNGTMLANLLAMSAALGLPARLVVGFVDADVNRLLDLDSAREVAFSLVAVGHSPETLPPACAEIPRLPLETVPLSGKEVDYPAMREMHQASALVNENEAGAWRGGLGVLPRPPREKAGARTDLQPLSDNAMPRDSTEQVIVRRGSSRAFAREPISFEQLSTILDRSTRGIPADFLQPPGNLLNDMYLIVNAVEGLQSGTYFFDREAGQLELLKPGDFRREAYHLGLEQELPGDAAVDVFFLADLDRILKSFGNRGYRATQLEAGIIGGKLYLAAYAQRLGATGLTFYDDDVVSFFSPHAQAKSAIFLVALGKSSRRDAP